MPIRLPSAPCDVFASITPYWLTTAGRSYSDIPYLRAALEASRSFKPETKKAAVSAGMLAPTIQTLIRKSLKGVEDEESYLTSKAHPTALPPGGVDMQRLAAAAKRMAPSEIPPLAAVQVATLPMKSRDPRPELTYASIFAWAFVLRADAEERVFHLKARGAEEFAFAKTHGDGVDVRIEKTGADSAKVTVNRRGMSPTNRVDVAVRDADDPTKYVLGIMCDGCGYASERTARDRDRLRDEVLGSLGWNIYHAWVVDWAYDRARAEKRLLEAFENSTKRKEQQ